MASPEKRLEDVVKGLSPEEKAKLVIEDLFREEPVLSPGNRGKVLGAMSDDEGRRYNAVIDRYAALGSSIRTLGCLADEARRHLLMRDRILWFLRALVEVEEAIVFDPKVADALLVNNPNLKPGKPLLLRVSFATVRLGVWGKKERSPVAEAGGVQLNERGEEALDLHNARAGCLAADMKAAHRYVADASRALGLDFVEGLATKIVRQIAAYDRPLIEDLMERGPGEGWEES